MIGDQAVTETHHQVLDLPTDALPSGGAASKCSDNDGHLRRTGTTWTAIAHIITAVIGPGLLSLTWAIAQLGWITGPAAIFLFSLLTYYTLLTVCDRFDDSVPQNRNQTYMDVVKSTLGKSRARLCGCVQYLDLFGLVIGYSIAAGMSMMAIKRSICFQKNGGNNPCHTNSNPFMIAFGIVEIVFSQILDFNQLWWLSTVAGVMSVICSAIVLCLGIAQVSENGKIKGSLTGISFTAVTPTQKIWRSILALQDIAFAFSYSLILVEIQDTLRSPRSEPKKMMKKASQISLTVITILYLLCGCMGYAAFGELSPGNVLTGFGFYNPFWLLDIAHIAIIILLVGAYQVYSQPLFAFIENQAEKRYRGCEFITKEIEIPLPGFHPYKLKLFRLVWRTLFVITTTIISRFLPYFNHVVGLFRALGFWPLTIYFPVEMFVKQRKIQKWSMVWLALQILNSLNFIVTIAGAVGSIVGIVLDLKSYQS